MKVAGKLIFLFNEPNGFATAILDALQPIPNSNLQRLEDSFELSLERYGIKDCKLSGNLVHFVDPNGFYHVSMLLMQSYEPPILACAVNEILTSVISGEKLSAMPKLILPIVVGASKVKLENSSKLGGNFSLCSAQIGSDADLNLPVAASKIPKLPQSLQIHHEPLSCFLQFVRVLQVPTFVLLGKIGQLLPNRTSGELEVICEVGEALATIASLSFLKERVEWKPIVTLMDSNEPWRDLYG